MDMNVHASSTNDPQLEEIVEFWKFAYREEGYRGTVQFNLKYPSGDIVKKSVLVHDEGLETFHGSPAAGESSVTCNVHLDRDTFFKIYMNEIHPQTAIMTGKLSVSGFRYRELGTFASSFDIATEKWNEFYSWKAEQPSMPTAPSLARHATPTASDEQSPDLLPSYLVQNALALRLASAGKFARYLQHPESSVAWKPVKATRARRMPTSVSGMIRTSVHLLGTACVIKFETMRDPSKHVPLSLLLSSSISTASGSAVSYSPSPLPLKLEDDGMVMSSSSFSPPLSASSPSSCSPSLSPTVCPESPLCLTDPLHDFSLSPDSFSLSPTMQPLQASTLGNYHNAVSSIAPPRLEGGHPSCDPSPVQRALSTHYPQLARRLRTFKEARDTARQRLGTLGVELVKGNGSSSRKRTSGRSGLGSIFGSLCQSDDMMMMMI